MFVIGTALMLLTLGERYKS